MSVVADRHEKIVPLNSQHKSHAEKGSNPGSLFQGFKNEVPTCPDHVKGEAKKHWNYMVKILKECGQASRLDQGTLANLCLYYAKAKEAQKLMLEDPEREYQVTPNGYLQLSPESVNFRTYSGMYNKLAEKFFMVPTVRAKVKIANPDQADLFDL